MNVLITDGETCETSRNEKGQLDMDNGQVYDLGGAVLNVEKEKFLTEFSIVNSDVFFNMPESMANAYYANKIPQYLEEIKNGSRKVMNTWQMWNYFYHICKLYDVKAIIAHNARFDIKTLNATMRYQTKSKKRYFLPYGIPILDSMKMANQTIAKSENYIQFCKDNGYMTNHAKPRPRVSAEVLWRYLSKDDNFCESHTGLEDVKIEAQIFLECVRRGYTLPFFDYQLKPSNQQAGQR